MAEEEKNEEKEEDSVYDEKGREELVEGGEISPEEAAFIGDISIYFNNV